MENNGIPKGDQIGSPAAWKVQLCITVHCEVQ